MGSIDEGAWAIVTVSVTGLVVHDNVYTDKVAALEVARGLKAKQPWRFFFLLPLVDVGDVV